MSAPASYREVAEMLGVRRSTVSDLVRTLGIEWKPIRANHRAKGLAPADVKKIKKALGMPLVAASA